MKKSKTLYAIDMREDGFRRRVRNIYHHLISKNILKNCVKTFFLRCGVEEDDSGGVIKGCWVIKKLLFVIF